MKSSLRIIAGFMAILMLLSCFVACDNTNVVDDTTTAADQGEDPKVLPEMNWEGEEYVILGRGGGSQYSFQDNFEIDYEEMPEDVVGLAVWNRNQSLMDTYGIDVVSKLVSYPPDTAKIAIDSGDDLYDLIVCSPEAFQPFASEGELLDLCQTKYINLEHDAWNHYADKQLTMGGKLYYTTNKFLLQDKNRSWMMFYNRTLAKELNLGYFESEVFDGTWTIDRVIEISRLGSSETDGADGMTYTDTWGMVLGDPYAFAQLAFGAGFRLTENGSDGYPKLIGATDKMITIFDKLYDLITSTDDCFVASIRPTADDSVDSYGLDLFFQGRGVIVAEAFSEIENMDQIDFVFGVLPNPKFDEDQKEYYSIPNRGNGCLLGIPATVEDVDFAGFALEAISEASVDTSYHAYIETRCKLQDAYDEDAAKCMGIIFDGVVYDIAFVMNLGGLNSLISSAMPAQKSNNYARNFDRNKKIADAEIKKIREAYQD